MNKVELEKKLVELRAKLQAFHFGAAGSKSKNVKEGRVFRRNIARILTAINK